jgi:hypothetical protein
MATDVRVFDVDGRQVSAVNRIDTHARGDSRTVRFIPSGLETGTYILHLQTTEGSVSVPMQVR